MGPATDTLNALHAGHPLTFVLFRQAPWHHYGLLALEESQLSVRTPFLDNDLVRTAFAAPHATLGSDEVCRRLIEDGQVTLARIPTDRAIGGRRGRVAAGLAHGLREFSRKAEYAYDYGMPQVVARVDSVLRGLRLERLFLGRHKFSHFRIWYRDRLGRYLRELLLDPRTLARPYLQRKTLEAIVAQHLSGHRNHTTEIHTVLTLELVHRLFIDHSR